MLGGIISIKLHRIYTFNFLPAFRQLHALLFTSISLINPLKINVH